MILQRDGYSKNRKEDENMELTEKGRELRNAYQRERYQQNKEKQRERMIKYWNDKAAEQEKQEQDEPQPLQL